MLGVMPDFYTKIRDESAKCFPENRKAMTILVGVYYDNGNHDLPISSLASEDFIWVNGKPNTKVAAVQNATVPRVLEKNPTARVHFRFGDGVVHPDTPLQDLNTYGDDFVLLFAIDGARLPLAPTQSLPNAMSMSPPSPYTSKAEQTQPKRASMQSTPARSTPGHSTPGSTTHVRYSPFSKIKPEPMETQPLPNHGSISRSSPQVKNEWNPSQASFSNGSAQIVKREPSIKSEASQMPNAARHHDERGESSRPQNAQLQNLFEKADVAQMEKGIEAGVELLETLRAALDGKDTEDAKAWLKQVDDVQKQAESQKTVVGVVGQTGAGKSSVINAILDVERLLPTNCMRACTACVTSIQYNDQTDGPYHAKIEFITAEDWAKELRVLYQDLLNEDGEVKRFAAESEAAVAWAKIKAVYPKKTKEMISQESVERLIRDPAVRDILGSTRTIDETDPLKFYKRLQKFVDSEEKSMGKDDKGPRETEFWPLIRVVNLYVKSPTLRSGVVLVDLPGVHDSNSARAAVADRFMQQCTGLWIVAPITRAVDDQSAKKLMGEGFRRQLLMDGGFSSISFICSKSDDISISEATLSLRLENDLESQNRELDELEDQKKEKKKLLEKLEESKKIYTDAQDELDDKLTEWEELKDRFEDGEEVFAPQEKKSKRKRGHSTDRKSKKARRFSEDDDDDFIVSDDEVEEVSDEGDEDGSAKDNDKGSPLTEGDIENKIEELKKTKKEGREEKKSLTRKVLEIRGDIGDLDEKIKRLECRIASHCIAARNKYSTGAIQHDFAAGLAELDQEAAEERYGDEFDPEKELRDYDAIANALPVFCVSSRGYQKLQGRLKKDSDLPAFENIDQTGIPALQQHAMKLTEKGRLASGRKFLTNVNQLCNSLSLWSATEDGSSKPLSAGDKASQTKMLDRRFLKLDGKMDEIVGSASKELKEELETIFDRYATATDLAETSATSTAEKWGRKVDRIQPSNGGLYWSTYKATVRREGDFKNSRNGEISFNSQLLEPLIKNIATSWEKVFTKRFPRVMQQYTRQSQDAIKAFHREVKQEAMTIGAGVAQLHLIEGQLNTYNDIFKSSTDDLLSQITAIQREVNREFIPYIVSEMRSSYQWCAAERGPGQFNRMKEHMVDHVETKKDTMFKNACETVKKRLLDMVKQVAGNLEEATARVFGMMERDYRSIFGGQSKEYSKGAILIDNKIREEMTRILAGFEEPFKKIVDADRPGAEDADGSSNAQDDMQAHNGHDENISIVDGVKDEKRAAEVPNSERGGSDDEQMEE